jgi:hypothetical protein
MRWRAAEATLAAEAALFSHIDAEGDCWLWTGALNHRGYGKFWRRIEGRWQCIGAHRAVWETLVGRIAPGLVLDHHCHNRACVNPDHLEPVTQSVNTLRARRHRKRKAAA